VALILGGAIIGVLLRKVLNALAVGDECHALVVTGDSALVVVAAKLLRNEHIGIPPATVPGNENGFFTNLYPVVQALYQRLRIFPEMLIPVFRVG
jgi:hypothetical protein